MRTATVASRQEDPFILLVDDNRDGLIARKAVLQEVGYRVQLASSCEEALQAFSAYRFDVVVTDYRMPRMSGAELIQKLRKIRPEIPIVLISGFVEPLGLTEENTGADVVIPKSAGEVPHLLRSVSRLINRQAKSGRRRPARKPPSLERTPSTGKNLKMAN